MMSSEQLTTAFIRLFRRLSALDPIENTDGYHEWLAVTEEVCAGMNPAEKLAAVLHAASNFSASERDVLAAAVGGGEGFGVALKLRLEASSKLAVDRLLDDIAERNELNEEP